MSDQVCEVCGKKLTKWNHAWGTNKCSRCARGRSPEAKLQKEAEDVQKFLEPFSSLDDVLRSSRSVFFVKAGLLLLVANAVALGGQVAAAMTKNTNFFWIQIVAFVVGVMLGSRVVFAESSLLDVKRWRTFWPCNIVGYILGYILFTTIAAFFRVLSTAQGTSLTPGQGTVVQASMVLPAVVGVAFAALMTAATDKRRKTWLTRKWKDLRGGSEKTAQ